MLSYQDLVTDVLENGELHHDRTGVGTLSVFGRQWRHNMAAGFPLLTTKKMPFRWIVEELLWFLSGSSDERALSRRGVDIWAEWATAEKCAEFGREPGDLGPVYGPCWRDFEGVDQIRGLLAYLKSSPESRRLIVTSWHPGWARQVHVPGCHTLWQVKCHGEDSMSLQLYMRSADLFLGVPFNIACYGLILSLLAHSVGRVPRELIVTFGDLHLYTNHLDVARRQVGRYPYPLPKLEIRPGVGLLDFRAEDLRLENYYSHSRLSGEVAI